MGPEKIPFTAYNSFVWFCIDSNMLSISENTGKFLLRDLGALTNSIYCNSQRGALMNRFPVMMTPIGVDLLLLLKDKKKDFLKTS